MSNEPFKAICLICYEPIDFELQDKALYTCFECGQTFHYNHLKVWIVQNKFCPNCKTDLQDDFVKFNASGSYVPCQDGFHLSIVNKHRKTCIRCLEPLSSEYGIRSNLVLNSKNALEYKPHTEGPHNPRQRNRWRTFLSIFKELITFKTIAVLIILFASILLTIGIFSQNNHVTLNTLIFSLYAVFVLYIGIVIILQAIGIIELDIDKPKRYKSPYEL